MATPDVRVRLSAEGVTDVIAAFRKIETEAAAINKKVAAQPALSLVRGKILELSSSLNTLSPAASSALRPMSALLGITGPLTAGIAGVVVSITAVAAAAKLAADEVEKLASKAEGIQNLAQSSSVSASNIQGLQHIIADAGLPVEGLGVGLRNLNKAIASGDPELKKLGVTSKDTFTALLQLSDAFEGAEDGPNKTAFAVRFLGRTGEELIPVLNRGSASIREQIQAARDLGLIFSDDVATALVDTDNKFDHLRNQVEGLKTELTVLAVPAVSGLVTELSKLLAKLNELPDALAKTKVGFRDLVAAQPGGQQLLAVTDLVERMKRVSSAVDQLQRAKGDLSRFTHTGLGPPDVPGAFIGPPAPLPAPPQDRKNATAALDGAKALADRQLALIHALFDAEESAAKAAYEQGLISMREFLDRRLSLLTNEHEKEVEALKGELSRVSDKDPKKADAERARIQNEIEIKGIQFQSKRRELIDDNADAERKLALDIETIEARADASRSADHQHRLAQIDEQVREFAIALGKQGASFSETVAAIAQTRGQLLSAENARSLLQGTKDAFSDLDRDRAAIQGKMAAGLISQADGERQLLALERQRAAALLAIAQAALIAAQASTDKEAIRDAERLVEQANNLGLAIEEADRLAQNLGESMRAAAQSNLAEGLASIGREGASLHSVLLQLLNDLQRLASQALAAGIFRAVGLGAPAGHAAGGLIDGPGTGTSDSILARVSAGEFIVPARVVSQPGILSSLEQLRRNGGMRTPQLRSLSQGIQVPRFAEGGLVPAGGGAGGTHTIKNDATLTVRLAPGTEVVDFTTHSGFRLLLHKLAANKNAVNALLGR